MIRPTPRAVVVFAAGIPISLVLALAAERLWPVGLVYLAGALMLTGLARFKIGRWGMRMMLWPVIGTLFMLVLVLTLLRE